MVDEQQSEWVQRCAENPGAEWRVQARDGDRKIEYRNEGVFDELVVDHWLHLEQLDRRTWWMRIGDARLQVAVGENGAVILDLQRGFYEPALGNTESITPDE